MRFLSLFLPEIKIRSIGLFRVSLVENIIIPQGVVDMDKRIAKVLVGVYILHNDFGKMD